LRQTAQIAQERTAIREAAGAKVGKRRLELRLAIRRELKLGCLGDEERNGRSFLELRIADINLPIDHSARHDLHVGESLPRPSRDR
jgi:hypothetical protein